MFLHGRWRPPNQVLSRQECRGKFQLWTARARPEWFQGRRQICQISLRTDPHPDAAFPVFRIRARSCGRDFVESVLWWGRRQFCPRAFVICRSRRSRLSWLVARFGIARSHGLGSFPPPSFPLATFMRNKGGMLYGIVCCADQAWRFQYQILPQPRQQFVSASIQLPLRLWLG